MYVLNITDEYGSFNNCTNNENEDIIFINKFLLLSIPNSILLAFLIGPVLYILIRPLKNEKRRIYTTSSSLYNIRTQRM